MFLLYLWLWPNNFTQPAGPVMVPLKQEWIEHVGTVTYLMCCYSVLVTQVTALQKLHTLTLSKWSEYLFHNCHQSNNDHIWPETEWNNRWGDGKCYISQKENKDIVRVQLCFLNSYYNNLYSNPICRFSTDILFNQQSQIDIKHPSWDEQRIQNIFAIISFLFLYIS